MQRPKFGYILLDKDGNDAFGRNIIKEKRYKASKHKGEPPFIAHKTFESLFDDIDITSLSRIIAVRTPQTAGNGRYRTAAEGILYSYTIDTLYEIDYKTFKSDSKDFCEQILALRTLKRQELSELVHGKNEHIIKEILRFGHKDDLDYIMSKPLKILYADAILPHRRKEDLARYRKSREPQNRVLVARYGYDEDLDILVHDTNWMVRESVAKRGRKKDRDILLKDESALVLQALALNLPKKDLPKIQHNNDPGILRNIIHRAEKAYLDEIINATILSNLPQSITKGLRASFAMRGFPDHLNIVRDTDNPTIIMEVLKHKRPKDLAYYYERATNRLTNDVDILSIMVPYANEEYLEKLRKLNNEKVNVALARRAISKDLDRLILSDNEYVLNAVAYAGREEDADILLDSKYPSVRKTVLSFGRHKAIKRCLKDKEPSIRAFAREIQKIQIVERKAKKTLLSGKPGLNGNMRGYEDD